jgi:heme-degrading monooxygenase HmoA
MMFSVLFEVHPDPKQGDAYLGRAKMLRPELEKIDGFVDNIRYRSLTREGWLLSLSGWRDEKALIRWRTQAAHHDTQERGRAEILLDYHLRVGQITQDTRLPEGQELREQRLDETEIGDANTVVLIDAKLPDPSATVAVKEVATWLGLLPDSSGLVAWHAFDAVLTHGDVILLISYRDNAAAEAYAASARLPPGARLRRVRVIRDYGMFDRRESPQYYPDVRDNASRKR